MKFKYHNRGQGAASLYHRLEERDEFINDHQMMQPDMHSSPIVGGMIAVENDQVNLPMVDSSRAKAFDSKVSTAGGGQH
jgi:hypothetical protein